MFVSSPLRGSGATLPPQGSPNTRQRSTSLSAALHSPNSQVLLIPSTVSNNEGGMSRVTWGISEIHYPEMYSIQGDQSGCRKDADIKLGRSASYWAAG